MTVLFICNESRIHHNNACIVCKEFGDFYDSAAHPVAAFLLQSFGIPQLAINVLLWTIETMRLCLRTWFRETALSYGGTHEECLAGYGKVNAAAGPSFTAMSSLILKAYLCNGFGAQIYSSYYKQLLLLAAVMYIDDTILIHWYCQPFCSLVELIVASQTATYVWGCLAIATGAVIKPEKCYAYFLLYWYDRGRVKLQTVWALPECLAPITLPSRDIAPSHLQVLLPDGSTAPIPTLHNYDASLILGIYFGPISSGRTHTCEMAQKRFIWANWMKSPPLPPSLAWQCFTHQLQPGMMWGLATVVLSPHKLLEQFQRVYFKCLPLVNVSCHIDLLWRLIPERYQGLGMANYALVSLASNLSFLQCNWGFATTHLTVIMMGYTAFMVKVGLYRNTMSYNYKRHSMLATSDT